MKIAVPVLALISMVGLGSYLHVRAQAQPGLPQATRTPVVVELFTSEGCSSCPPADQLLARLAAEQPVNGAEIIALEEHVDYWDRLGWTDPFSSEVWTERQYAYAATLDNGNVYTPQMIVDGREAFVGGGSRPARTAIERAARQEKALVSVAAVEGVPGKSQDFQITVGKLPPSAGNGRADVWMAVTETGLHTAVPRGENAGADLHHSAVVRRFEKVGSANGPGDATFSGTRRVALDSKWKRESLRCVVFVQERDSRRILGAASVPFLP